MRRETFIFLPGLAVTAPLVLLLASLALTFAFVAGGGEISSSAGWWLVAAVFAQFGAFAYLITYDSWHRGIAFER